MFKDDCTGSSNFTDKMEVKGRILRLILNFLQGERCSLRSSFQVQELKLKYYDLMIKIGLSENAYLDVCGYYRAIYDTPRIEANAEKTKQVLLKKWENFLRLSHSCFEII